MVDSFGIKMQEYSRLWILCKSKKKSAKYYSLYNAMLT